MSEANELLNSLTEESISARTIDSATEPHIVIGKDRKVTVPDELKRIAVQFDHNIETVTFDCPRYWDKNDMSKMVIYINYMRSDGTIGSCPATNIVIDETNTDMMHFDWTISENVTAVNGNLTFLVCIKKTDNENKVTNHWNSEINTEMYISEGLNFQNEDIVNNDPDLITSILTRLNDIESDDSITLFEDAIYGKYMLCDLNKKGSYDNKYAEITIKSYSNGTKDIEITPPKTIYIIHGFGYENTKIMKTKYITSSYPLKTSDRILYLGLYQSKSGWYFCDVTESSILAPTELIRLAKIVINDYKITSFEWYYPMLDLSGDNINDFMERVSVNEKDIADLKDSDVAINKRIDDNESDITGLNDRVSVNESDITDILTDGFVTTPRVADGTITMPKLDDIVKNDLELFKDAFHGDYILMDLSSEGTYTNNKAKIWMESVVLSGGIEAPQVLANIPKTIFISETGRIRKLEYSELSKILYVTGSDPENPTFDPQPYNGTVTLDLVSEEDDTVHLEIYDPKNPTFGLGSATVATLASIIIKKSKITSIVWHYPMLDLSTALDTKIYTGVCFTDSNTAVKEVTTTNGDFELKHGAVIIIDLQGDIDPLSSAIKFNIDGTGDAIFCPNGIDDYSLDNYPSTFPSYESRLQRSSFLILICEENDDDFTFVSPSADALISLRKNYFEFDKRVSTNESDISDLKNRIYNVDDMMNLDGDAPMNLSTIFSNDDTYKKYFTESNHKLMWFYNDYDFDLIDDGNDTNLCPPINSHASTGSDGYYYEFFGNGVDKIKSGHSYLAYVDQNPYKPDTDWAPGKLVILADTTEIDKEVAAKGEYIDVDLNTVVDVGIYSVYSYKNSNAYNYPSGENEGSLIVCKNYDGVSQIFVNYMIDNEEQPEVNEPPKMYLRTLYLSTDEIVPDSDWHRVIFDTDMNKLTKVYIAMCSTDENTSTKVITTTNGDFKLKNGAVVNIHTMCTINPLANGVKFNIDGTGDVAFLPNNLDEFSTISYDNYINTLYSNSCIPVICIGEGDNADNYHFALLDSVSASFLAWKTMFVDTTRYVCLSEIADDINNKVDHASWVSFMGNTTPDYATLKEVCDGINSKADKINYVYSDETTASVTLEHNTEYRFDEYMVSLTVTLPEDITEDYAAYIVFSSWETATEIIYPDHMKWGGDDVIDGVFTPLPYRRYNVGVWYDGAEINAVARGVSI